MKKIFALLFFAVVLAFYGCKTNENTTNNLRSGDVYLQSFLIDKENPFFEPQNIDTLVVLEISGDYVKFRNMQSQTVHSTTIENFLNGAKKIK